MKPPFFAGSIARIVGLCFCALLCHAAHAQPCAVQLPIGPFNLCGADPLNLVATGTGRAPLSYTWSGSTALSPTTGSQTTLNVPVPVNTQQNLNLTVTMTDDTGCVATATIAVTVRPTPRADLTVPDGNINTSTYNGVSAFALCGTGDPQYLFPFTDASSGTAHSYVLDWGDGSPDHTASAAGWQASHTYSAGNHVLLEYTVTNTSSGCDHTAEFVTYIGSNPAIGFASVGNASICAGGTLPFTISTEVQNNSPGTEHYIDFGDGTPYLYLDAPPQAQVAHTFLTSSCEQPENEFTVMLHAVNACRTRSQAIPQISVSEAPNAAFTIPPGGRACAGVPVTFVDQSTGSQAPQCASPRKVWSITPAVSPAPPGLGSTNNTLPNGWTSGADQLVVTFPTPGDYCVKLLVGSNLCGRDSVEHCICIEEAMAPAFDVAPQTVCIGQEVQMTNNSGTPASCASTLQWSVTQTQNACGPGASATYVNGTNSTSPAPRVRLDAPGVYNVELRQNNSCGDRTATRTINVGARPQVTVATLDSICAGESITPQATFTPCGTPIIAHGWAFLGGSPDTVSAQVPGTITYPTQGNYAVRATATSACGPGMANTTIAVNQAPAAPIVPDTITVCPGEDIVLQATPVSGVTFTWRTPGNVATATTIPNATPAMAGIYSVTPSNGDCDGPVRTVVVQVSAVPGISITPSTPAICSGDSITFTASGASNLVWTLNTIQQGTGPSVTIHPTQSDTIAVAGDAGGSCPVSASMPFTVNNRPVADGGPPRVFCDQPVGEVLQPVTAGGTWSGDHVTGAGVFTPAGTGSFTLQYTVVSAQNCSTTVDVPVRVDPPPTPPVVGNDTLLCQFSGDLQLAATPSGGAWSAPATQQGLFTPAQTGVHTLVYTTGTGSCAARDTLRAQVVAATPVQLSTPDLRICISVDTVQLSPLATPAGGTWSGLGVSNAWFLPEVAGATTAGQPHDLIYAYTDANGCTTRDTLRANVHALPIVNAGADVTFCDQPLPQQLLGFSPAGGVWTGNHVDATGLFTPNGVGSHTLTYMYADTLAPGNLCVDSAQIVVTVVAIDNPADAGPDREVCFGDPVLNLSVLPAGGTWSGSPWITADGVFTPGEAGDHELMYSEGTGSCVTMDLVTITVHPLPLLTITSLPDVCPDAGIQTATADPPGGSWSGTGIVDGSMGTFDPALSGEGRFELTYHFTDAHSCTNSIADSATVRPFPVAAFTHAPIACAGAPFPFVDNSTGNTTWNWTFGDGATSTDADPQHTYTAPGTYDVMLVAATGHGCRDTAQSTVEVWEGPALAFTAGPELDGCAVLTVELTNASTGEGLDFAWDFGNGGTSDLQHPPSVDYSASAYTDTTYTINLRVTNLCASVDSSVTVTVHPSPTARFGPDFDSGCSPWPVTFSNVSIGMADTYAWDFGDGSALNTMDSLVMHTYLTGTNDTTFTVTLTATNQCGSDQHTYDVQVRPNSITAFFNTSTTSGCSPLTVNFTQYSIGVSNWHWDLGDGNVSTAADVTHTYSPGTWLATLYGDNGCSYDTVSVVIEVSPSPLVAFDMAPQPVCAGAEVTLTNLSSGVASTTWDLGDGNTSTLSILTHTYPEAGSYPVTLTVVSIDNGCPASLTRQLEVAPLPVAAFSVNEPVYCAPTTLLYTNESAGTQLNSRWRLDGEVFSHLFHPLPQQTTATGPHVVSLVVTDPFSGCQDSIASTIMGYATPEASFVLQPVDPCGRPAAVLATNTSTSDALVSWWLDGALQGTQAHLVTSIMGAGEHVVELVAEMPGPCLDTARTAFTLPQLPAAAFTPDTACVGQSIPITDESLHVVASWWFFNDTLVGSDPHTGLVPVAPGPDTVKVVVMGEGGCLDSLTRIVRSYPTPLASYLADVADDCETVQLVAPEHQLMTYEWEVDGLHWTADRVTRYHYGTDITGRLHIALRMTNIHGCADTEAHHWEVPSCVYVPNTFTPNGDLVNDAFGPNVVPFARDWSMLIFDRWGRVVKELNPADPLWNGEGADGEELPIGVYNWRMTHVEPQGVSKETRGHVNVVR